MPQPPVGEITVGSMSMRALKTVCKSSGYTLIELILYISISSVIVLFTFSIMRSASMGYTTERRKGFIQTKGKDAIAIMSNEITNTGFKIYLQKIDGVFYTDTLPMITTGENGEAGLDGNSSFFYTPSDSLDELVIFKGSLNSQGEKVSIDRVTYRVRNGVLERELFQYDESAFKWDSVTTWELASNVEALKFQFSTNNETWTNSIAGVKSNIKSMRIYLLLRTETTSSTKIKMEYTINSKVYKRDDTYTRRLYQESVEIANNGT